MSTTTLRKANAEPRWLRRTLTGNFAVTDEASALEAAGYKPRLVKADTTNLKVTFPADLRIAELVLQGEKS